MRILVISDVDDWSDVEDLLWFVEPSQMEKRGESGWR